MTEPGGGSTRPWASWKGNAGAGHPNLLEFAEGAIIIDSQSVKTTEAGGLRGYDADKRVKGCKQHIIVDTLGNLLEVVPGPSRQQGFQVLPRRWVVERTLGWLNRYRRLSKSLPPWKRGTMSVWLKAVKA